jgi:hypothetical protein
LVVQLVGQGHNLLAHLLHCVSDGRIHWDFLMLDWVSLWVSCVDSSYSCSWGSWDSVSSGDVYCCFFFFRVRGWVKLIGQGVCL